MKKLLTFVLFAFLFINLTIAQSSVRANIEFSQTRKHYAEFQQQQRDSIVKKNTRKTVKYVKYYNKKGKLKRSTLREEGYYDSLGNLIQQNTYTFKGKLYRNYKFGYDAKGIQTSYRSYNSKGKLLRGWDLSFNEKGLMNKATHYKKKEGRISWVELFEYNADSNVIKTQNANKKNEVYITLEYVYQEDGQKKEVRKYNKRGKLKSVIKYDCLPTGIQSNSKKADTTTVYYKDNIDEDGNAIYTTERIQQNGKVVRAITMVSPDKKYSEYSFINHKNQLLFKRTYTSDNNGHLIETSLYYPKNSKRNKHLRYTINRSDDNRVYTTRQYGYKNQLVSVRTVVSY